MQPNSSFSSQGKFAQLAACIMDYGSCELSDVSDVGTSLDKGTADGFPALPASPSLKRLGGEGGYPNPQMLKSLM